MKRYGHYIALPFVLWCLLAQTTNASVQEELNEQRLDSANDWISYVDVTRLNNYFNYNGSRLYPVTNLRVTYRVVADQSVNHTYEDLWYHNGRILGSHRESKLLMGNRKLGTIIIRRTLDVGVESAAIANCIARLILDLKLKDETIAAIIIPTECFHQVCTDLGRYGFYKHGSDSYFPFSLHLTSSPPSYKNDLYLFSE